MFFFSPHSFHTSPIFVANVHESCEILFLKLVQGLKKPSSRTLFPNPIKSSKPPSRDINNLSFYCYYYQQCHASNLGTILRPSPLSFMIMLQSKSTMKNQSWENLLIGQMIHSR
jgi:hypothetical protein